MTKRSPIPLDPGSAADFLSALFGHESLDGLSFGLFTLPGAGTEWFTDPEDMATRATELASNHHVYVRMTPVAELPDPGRRGDANLAAALVGLWTEVDYGPDGHNGSKTYPPDEESARTLIREAIALEPSLIVHSGGGLHVYWLFTEPLLLADLSARGRAAKLVLRLQSTLAQVARNRGWAVDSTFDLARVLRVPGTRNLKLDGEPRPVRLLESSGRRYSPDDFDDILIEIDHAESAAVDISVRIDTGTGREPPSGKLEALLAADKRFEATWNHQRTDLNDQSLSGYDLAIAGTAARADWADQDIADLIAAFRDRHGSDERDRAKGRRADYLARTIAKARSGPPPEPMPAIDGPRGLQLRATNARETPTRRTVEFELWRGDERLECVSATDTKTGKEGLGRELLDALADAGEVPERADTAAIRSFARRALSPEVVRSALRVVAERERAESEESGGLPSMIDIATEHLRDELDLRFMEDDRNGPKAWSEARGALVSQRSITSERDPKLLERLKEAHDYAGPTIGDPSKPIRHLAFTMQVVWTALTKPLPSEAGETGLDARSKAAERFAGQMLRLWLTTGTWATEGGEERIPRHDARQRRTSFAGRVAAESANAPAQVWHPVLKDVRVYFAADDRGEIWLGLHHDIIHHGVKGAELPGVTDAQSLRTLVERYGLSARDPAPPAGLVSAAARRHIVVLSREFTDRVLSDDCGTAQEIDIDGMSVDPVTGEVSDAC